MGVIEGICNHQKGGAFEKLWKIMKERRARVEKREDRTRSAAAGEFLLIFAR